VIFSSHGKKLTTDELKQLGLKDGFLFGMNFNEPASDIDFRGRAGASKSGVGEDCQEVVGVEGTLQAFVLDAALVRLLLPQQADAQAAGGGQVGRTVAVLLSA
jgi:hypothetical protein